MEITLDQIPMKPINLPLASAEVLLLAKRQRSIPDMGHPQLAVLEILLPMVRPLQVHKCASSEQLLGPGHFSGVDRCGEASVDETAKTIYRPQMRPPVGLPHNPVRQAIHLKTEAFLVQKGHEVEVAVSAYELPLSSRYLYMILRREATPITNPETPTPTSRAAKPVIFPDRDQGMAHDRRAENCHAADSQVWNDIKRNDV